MVLYYLLLFWYAQFYQKNIYTSVLRHQYSNMWSISLIHGNTNWDLSPWTLCTERIKALYIATKKPKTVSIRLDTMLPMFIYVRGFFKLSWWALQQLYISIKLSSVSLILMWGGMFSWNSIHLPHHHSSCVSNLLLYNHPFWHLSSFLHLEVTGIIWFVYFPLLGLNLIALIYLINLFNTLF